MANDNFDLPRPTDAVPSATSAVLNDNSKVLDYVINGEGTVENRAGNELLTLDEAISRINWSYVGLFADGVTFSTKTDFATDAVGTQWVYNGPYPFTATAGTVPSAPDYQVVHVRATSQLDDDGGLDGAYARTFSLFSDLDADANLKIGQTVVTSGNLSSGVGGAEYEIVAAASGTEAEGYFDASASSLQARLRSQTPNPHMFGVQDGVESTSELQNFANYICNTAQISACLTCNTIVNAEVLFEGDGTTLETATRYWFGDLKVSLAAPLSTPLLRFNNSVGTEISGKLDAVGGGATFTTRNGNNAIQFDTCARMKIDQINTTGFKRDGVVFGPVGNKNMMTVGKISAIWCGSNPTSPLFELSASYSGSTNAGSSGSVSQRTTFTGVTVPPEVEERDIVEVGGYPYLVTSVTASTVEVYPWVNSSYAASGTLQFISGAGAYLEGSDSGEIGIDVLDVTGCGAGARSGALYGVNIGRHVSQNCGVSLAIGLRTVNSHLADNVDFGYFEANTFDIVKIASPANSFSMSSDIGLDYSKVFNGSVARLVDDTFNLGTKLDGFSVSGNGFNTPCPNDQLGKVGTAVLKTGSVETSHTEVIANTVAVTLEYDADKDRLFGFNSLRGTHLGTGFSNEPVGTITLTPADSAWSIDGGAAGASITFTGLTKPLQWVAVADPGASNWRVARFDGV